MRVLLISLLWVAPALADMEQVATTVDRLLPDMPRIQIVKDLSTECGHRGHANGQIAYCTSENVVFVTPGYAVSPQAAYGLAHMMGHAAQVRFGLADLALAAIRQDRAEEAALRAKVTRQVECLAGAFLRAANVLYDPSAWTEEPFTGPHWGRNPLSIGPKVSIGRQARAAALRQGQAGGLAACDAPGLPIQLVLDNLRAQ